MENNTNYPQELNKNLTELVNNDDNNTLFDYQKIIYNYMTKLNKRGILLYHSVGSGKCMAKDTKILMYNGEIKNIQDINTGELLMGDNNSPRQVLSTTTGKDIMYDVFYNNTKYTVNKAHILCLKANNYPLYKKYKNYIEIEFIENNKFNKNIFYNTNDAKKAYNKYKLTEQIIELPIYKYIKLNKNYKNILKGYKKDVEFKYKNVNIDPYPIGIWIANDYKKNINKESYLYNEITKLGLHNDKFIPDLYKINSHNVRLEILAGIIDTIGIYKKDIGIILNINDKYTTLIDDILFICNSVGILSKTLKNDNIISVYIYGNNISKIPSKDIVIRNTNGIFSSGYSITVQMNKYDNYYGFTLDGNGRYLLNDFSVTHNTITSISIAEYFKKLQKEIIILSSKSLQINYKKEIVNYNKMQNKEEILDDDEYIKGYRFVTSNAKNMISSLENTTNKNKNKIDIILENINKSNLENKVIIVDEAHNLFNSIVNGSKTANEFYDIIMKTKNIKLIFLTGTPVINDPFELAVCFNMLNGHLSKKTKGKDAITLLPEYYTDFNKYFVDKISNNIKNEAKFKNRIFGLVSYYGDFYKEKQTTISDNLKQLISKENYPDRLPVKFEIIEMSQVQNANYAKARDKEKLENSFKYGSSVVKNQSLTSTSYRIKSRQLSNIFIYPSQELQLYNINKYSPKMEKIYKNITENHKNSINLVYSTFLEYGIIAFSKILILHGYKEYKIDEEYEDGVKYFALFSGNQTSEEKEDILKTINKEDNVNGKYISILLISKSGTEGIDLKNIRSIHIMEPYWNFSLIQQIIARGVRYKSHILLDEKDRTVQPYIYLSDYNKEFLQNEKNKIKEKNSTKKIDIELTTDINMFKNALKNQELIYNFLKCIASTSIDCKFFNNNSLNYECFDCYPNNKPLFSNDIDVDMITSNNCSKSQKVKATEIIIDGITYYYTNVNNEVNVFEYNQFINAYTPTENSYAIEKIKEIINK